MYSKPTFWCLTKIITKVRLWSETNLAMKNIYEYRKCKWLRFLLIFYANCIKTENKRTYTPTILLSFVFHVSLNVLYHLLLCKLKNWKRSNAFNSCLGQKILFVTCAFLIYWTKAKRESALLFLSRHTSIIHGNYSE